MPIPEMANVDALLSLRGISAASFCGPPADSSSSWARPKVVKGAAAGANGAGRLVVGADGTNPWRASAKWAKANPISEIFEEAQLDRAMSDALSKREEEASKAAPDISDFLIEKHLWGDGLTPAMLQQECSSAMLSTHARLLRRFTNPADYRKATGNRLDAKATLLGKVAKTVTADLESGKSWKTLEVGKPEGSPGSRHGVGDTTGLFYYLGTKCGETSYANPASREPKLLKVSQMSGEGNYWDYGSGESLVGNSNDNRCMTYAGGGQTPQAWIRADIMAEGVRFMPTAYKLRFYSSSSARDWEFQGSNDGKEWTTLSKHTNEGSVQECKCVTFPCEPAGVYSSFRLLAGGPGLKLLLYNWEIYGNLL